jgi:rod shape-determining protein MreC
MVISTLDSAPPPFFRQGHSALSKLVFFSLLALLLMIADSHFTLVRPLRVGIATVLNPVQMALRVPVEMWQGGSDYLRGLRNALAGESAAREQLALQSERAARVEQLTAENARLRALLELRPTLFVRTLPAEVLYEAGDLYSRKVYVDRGSTHGVALGSPVMNEEGVLGQVTEVYPLTSEITLLADKDAAIPVINSRTQRRGAAFGGPDAMELRFMTANSDVQVGDALFTSGVDGVYPPGLPVAKVSKIDREADGGFAHILLQTTARPEGVRHLLVLEPVGKQLPPKPVPEVQPTAAAAASAASAAKGRRR